MQTSKRKISKTRASAQVREEKESIARQAKVMAEWLERWTLIFSVYIEEFNPRGENRTPGDLIQVAQRIAEHRGCHCGKYRVVTENNTHGVLIEHEPSCPLRPK